MDADKQLSEPIIISQQIKVDKQGIQPKNPSVQILNEDDFYITWTGLSINSTDEFYVQAFKRSTLINTSNIQIVQNTVICSTNCISCKNSTTCNIGSNGYYQQNGYCEINCGNNCQQCSKPFECDRCAEGYFINQQNSCEMIDCEVGFKLNENYECEPACSENCNICQSFNVCLDCKDSFYLSQGQCFDLTHIAINTPQEQSTLIIISYILAIIVIISMLTLITWYYKKKNQSVVNLQENSQVVNERQETYIAHSNSSCVE